MYSRFYLSVLLISSLLFLTYMALVAFNGVMPEWKYYQLEYKDLLIKNAKDDAARKRAEAIPVKLQQIYLSAFNKEDRCTSCHIGIDNPLVANAKLPFKKHSGDYIANHPVDKFGCTVCHEGQGSATNKREAHAKGHTYWDYPTLPLSYIQSSCAKCHDFDMLSKKGGDKVAEGDRLFREKGCQGCHKINKVGGDLGKPLDGVGNQPIAYFSMKHVIGDHTVPTWLKQHFDDPRAIVPTSEMKVKLKGPESDLLTIFALTLRSDELPKAYRYKTYAQPPKQEGETLYKTFCSACHGEGTQSLYDEVLKRTIPAIMNPSFLKIADDKNLETIIKEGRNGTQMTAWKTVASGLSEDDVKSIIGYIASKRPAEAHEPFPIKDLTGDVNHGKELYAAHCAVCHGQDAKGGENLIGINLKNPTVTKMVDPEFLAVTIRDGREGTSMPPFGKEDFALNNQDIVDVVAYIRDSSKGSK
ncbi:MAG: c-type cytochrome [Nitrospirae bacterium]|nr:c-type cytochrome [Nitrospirota bacterium]